MLVQKQSNAPIEWIRKVGRWLFEPPHPSHGPESAVWIGMSIEPCRFTEQLNRLQISLNGSAEEVPEAAPVRVEE
jgi:hypothetical protein